MITVHYWIFFFRRRNNLFHNLIDIVVLNFFYLPKVKNWGATIQFLLT